MRGLGDIWKRRRLRKAIAEAVVLKALRGHDFPDDELDRLAVGGPERPLGDVFDAQYFVRNPFCRTRYVFHLACLIRECEKCLKGEGVVHDSTAEPVIQEASPQEIAKALDPLLEYCLNGLQFVFENPNGPGAMGREVFLAFQDLPRDLCGRAAMRKIAEIEKK